MRIVSFPEADVPRELRVQVRALHDEAWPDYKAERDGPVHDPALRPLSMLLLDGDRVLSALDILSKQIHHRGQRLRRQRAEHGRDRQGQPRQGPWSPARAGCPRRDRGERRRPRHLHLRQPTAGVLRARRLAAPPRHGARRRDTGGAVSQRPVRQGHHGALLLAARAQALADTFVGCRIELYPGEIDKLW